MTDLVQRLREMSANKIWVGSQHMREAADRIEQLEASLKKTNDQFEHFEREWYLRGDRIEELERENAELRKQLSEKALQEMTDFNQEHGLYD